MLLLLLTIVISLFGLYLTLLGFGFPRDIPLSPRVSKHAGQVSFRLFVPGFLLLVGSWTVLVTVYLSRQINARNQVKQLEFELADQGLDKSYAEIPYRHLHEQGNSAWNLLNAAELLLTGNGSGSGIRQLEAIEAAIPLNVPGPQGSLPGQLLPEDAALDVAAARRAFSTAPMPEVLHQVREAAARVQFWHVSRRFLLDEAAEREGGAELQMVPRMLRLANRLLLSQALIQAREGNLPRAYGDLTQALNITSQLTQSELQWHRARGQELLRWNLLALEYLGTHFPVPVNDPAFQALQRALRGIDLFSGFDQVALRSLVYYEQQLFTPEGKPRRPAQASAPAEEAAEAQGNAEVDDKKNSFYMPLPRWPRKVLEPAAVRHLAYLELIQGIATRFQEKPRSLARTEISGVLTSRFRADHIRVIRAFLEPHQQSLLQLERRRRLAIGALQLYSSMAGQEQYLPDLIQSLRGLDLKNIIDPETHKLPALETSTLPRAPFLHYPSPEKAHAASRDNKPATDAVAARSSKSWALADPANLRFPESAPEKAGHAAQPSSPAPVKTDAKPQAAPAPSTAAAVTAHYSSRAELLRAARRLKQDRQALLERKPGPGADPAEMQAYQQELATLRRQTKELREAAAQQPQ
jgi:hypothetical protein